MLGMIWIALELSNPMVGLITRLSLLAKNLTAFKYGKVAKSGNAESDQLVDRPQYKEMAVTFSRTGN